MDFKTIFRGKGRFSLISLKIKDARLAGAVSAGALSLAALYVVRKYPAPEDAIKRALQRNNNLGVVDPKVTNISGGSILVELHCYTETSFLVFLEDFETKTIKFRLEEEFKKIGFERELDVTITNAEDVYEKARQIRERSRAPREGDETGERAHGSSRRPGDPNRAGTIAFAEMTIASNMDPPETDGPPLIANQDLPDTSKPLEDGQLPIDILLLTVDGCEFLSCLSYLSSFTRYRDDKLGIFYIGYMGDERMKIAVMKCDMGSSGPGGSSVVGKNAVEVLRPKAAFSVGYCAGLNTQKVKLGDVVVSAKLITNAPTKVLEDGIQERGVRAPVPRRILKLIKHVADGWKPPLKDPEKLTVAVHRDGVFLSGPELVDNKERCEELVKRFPDAIAIEMEDQGCNKLFPGAW